MLQFTLIFTLIHREEIAHDHEEIFHDQADERIRREKIFREREHRSNNPKRYVDSCKNSNKEENPFPRERQEMVCRIISKHSNSSTARSKSVHAFMPARLYKNGGSHCHHSCLRCP